MSEQPAQEKYCGEDSLCQSMESRIGGEHTKGLSIASTINLTSGQVRMLGVVYKKNPKDNGLLLNVCPWCMGKPGYFKRGIA